MSTEIWKKAVLKGHLEVREVGKDFRTVKDI